MAYSILNGTASFQQIADTSTTQNHELGTVVVAEDPTYGGGTFIYLKGIASTAVGDVVGYEQYTGVTVRTVAATRGPLAVAMSANVASQYGWYQVQGAAVVSVATVDAADTLSVTATAGQLDDITTAAQGVIGLKTITANGTPSAGLAVCQIHWPGAYHTTNV